MIQQEYIQLPRRLTRQQRSSSPAMISLVADLTARFYALFQCLVKENAFTIQVRPMDIICCTQANQGIFYCVDNVSIEKAMYLTITAKDMIVSLMI